MTRKPDFTTRPSHRSSPSSSSPFVRNLPHSRGMTKADFTKLLSTMGERMRDVRGVSVKSG